MNHLLLWAVKNEIKINEEKNRSCGIQEGWTTSREWENTKHKKIVQVPWLELQIMRKSFSVHVKERLVAAIRAILDITNPTLLSLRSTMWIFKIKVCPTLTCGLELIWDNLTYNQLKAIEGIKACFLKRILEVS